ncbi:hypothetical protein CRE_16461 [Caenorhabditis remanei]|uniref:Uncharacterized protein n=1 Tax=Caenorhabditis remanei TaxID=31234 RepID=E3NHC6_CAERE|nr:hypothetical protein CRE_16461 [Caenorhabditis remanei]
MSLSTHFLLLAVIGAAIAAPLKVEYVLAPVPLKQSSTDPTKLVAVVPLQTPTVVIKFDKPILAEIEKTSEFESNFEQVPIGNGGESVIVKLKVKSTLEKPAIVNIKDTKNGDSVKVMVMAEDGRLGGSDVRRDKLV